MSTLECLCNVPFAFRLSVDESDPGYSCDGVIYRWARVDVPHRDVLSVTSRIIRDTLRNTPGVVLVGYRKAPGAAGFLYDGFFGLMRGDPPSSARTSTRELVLSIFNNPNPKYELFKAVDCVCVLGDNDASVYRLQSHGLEPVDATWESLVPASFATLITFSEP